MVFVPKKRCESSVIIINTLLRCNILMRVWPGFITFLTHVFAGAGKRIHDEYDEHA
jgi:hypothetical protein